MDDSNIAWKSDVAYKFFNMDSPDWQSKQWYDVTDRKWPLRCLLY